MLICRELEKRNELISVLSESILTHPMCHSSMRCIVATVKAIAKSNCYHVATNNKDRYESPTNMANAQSRQYQKPKA